MSMLWASWNLGQAATLCAALAFSLALNVPLARAAWRLPRALDGTLPAEPTAAHRLGRRAFLLAAPLLAVACAWRFGATGAALAAIVFVSVLLVLAWIDAETGYLPDRLTLPLLWLGLLVNMDAAFAPLAHAVAGAAGGYLAFWCVVAGFRALTGREALGRGDCKLLAALGAWLGWTALPRIVFAAACLGLAVALARRLAGRLAPGEAFGFGPFLAAAGVAALWGM
ncbi:A24 family peptidase [Castellaniella defragrans]|uniref:prepilin peptidase n=1 Tax=Castellaniella defragrans TaxID=75697 RepID=UPI002AFEE440|nr:A24 family peptidase [Castellaniella defragrans]